MPRHHQGKRARYRTLVCSLRAARYLAASWLTLVEIGQLVRRCARTARRIIYALRAAGVDVLQRLRSDITQHRRAWAMEYRIDRRSWFGLVDVPTD